MDGRLHTGVWKTNTQYPIRTTLQIDQYRGSDWVWAFFAFPKAAKGDLTTSVGLAAGTGDVEVRNSAEGDALGLARKA